MTDSRLTVNAHVLAGVDQCTSCHTVAELEKNHNKVSTVGSSFTELKYSNDFCLKCHGTNARLAELTANSTVFQTPEGKYINPHLPATANHDTDVECSQCHKFHATKDPLDYCITCHMKRVLECNTCHGSGGVKD